MLCRIHKQARSIAILIYSPYLYVQVKPVRGIYIYRFQSPLYFANGAVFKARLAAGCGIDPYRTKQDSPGCFSTLFKKVGMMYTSECHYCKAVGCCHRGMSLQWAVSVV